MLHFNFLKRKKQMKRIERSEQQPRTRKFAPNIPYVFPKDVKEVDRLDYQHYVLRLLFNGNIVAPVEEGTVHRIPAVGCGTGRWCREGAETSPSAMVIGTDIEEHVSPVARPAHV